MQFAGTWDVLLVLVMLLLAVLTSESASASRKATCSCSNRTRGVWGKCRKSYTKADNSGPICYVNEPSNCPDIQVSQGRKFSWEACRNQGSSSLRCRFTRVDCAGQAGLKTLRDGPYTEESCYKKCTQYKGCNSFVLLDDGSKCTLRGGACKMIRRRDRKFYRLAWCRQSKKPQPVDGGWSEYGSPTPCSKSCGGGRRILKRTCTNPKPRYGGRTCIGASTKEEACNRKACPGQYDTALLLAAKNGKLRVVKSLVTSNRANINATNELGKNALMLAASNGHGRVVKYLLKKKVDPNLLDSNNWTALVFATYFGQLHVVRLLVAGGANVNLSGSGWSPLALAAYFGHKDVARVLVENHADVNHQDVDGETALMLAAEGGHWKIVKLLVANKADVHLRNNEGWTAQQWAKSNNKYYIAEYLKSKMRETMKEHVVKYLKERESKIKLKTH